MEKKTKYLQLRLTSAEARKLKEMAKDHDSVSQYILCAVKGFSDLDSGLRLDLINMLAKSHRKGRDEMSWAGGNISQTVKRTKELVDAGQLSSFYLKDVLLPETNKTLNLINEIKKKLDTATQKAIRLGLTMNGTTENT